MNNQKMARNVTGAQIRAARALLGWSQQQLADRAAVARPTLMSFETQTRCPLKRVRENIVNALEVAGVEFINDDCGRIGVYVVPVDN